MAKPRKFGPFEIEEKLGVGGMGIPYRARYAKTGQIVALKVLSPNYSADERVQQRFNREMEILKRLDHKNVVKYYGGGMLGNQHFYAMELMEGGSVDEVLKKKGRLSWEQTIEVGKAVAKALEHAHYYGIIHRDLKPANLFLTKQGRLKLGDFGIARDTERTALTAAGKTVGTYAYMAPEQISGSPPVSRKTDQYALGCVMFELLTGRPPFEAENPAQMLMQHLEIKPPRVSSLCADCPVWLENVIQKLMEKDPEDRYYDALAVHTALVDVGKKVAEGASIVKQTVSGDVTVAEKTKDPELRRALRNKKKKKRRRKQPFYERVWFLTACLVLLIGVVTWAVWPLSDEEKFRRGKELMDRAAKLDLDDDNRAVLLEEAGKEYFEPLKNGDGPYADEAEEYLREIKTDRIRRRAERKIRMRSEPEPGGERMYVEARRAEIAGDRVRALDRYARLIKLLKDRKQDEDQAYVTLAKQRRSIIFGKGSKGDINRELADHALERAREHMKKGEIVEARELWEAIINEFGDNDGLQKQVDEARTKLTGSKPNGETGGSESGS